MKSVRFQVLLLVVLVGVATVGYLKWWRGRHPARGETIPGDMTAEVKPGPFDWPQFRGPARDGTSPEASWNPTWSGAPKELWRKEVGIGASSMAVSRGRLYTAGNIGGSDAVYCLSAETGTEIWRFVYPCPLAKRQFEGGPGATPTVDGDHVYMLSQEGQLFCLDALKGTQVWGLHVVGDLGGHRPRWCYAGSVLIADGKLIADIGGTATSTVALEKGTGKTIWKSGDQKAGYSSPVRFEQDGKAAVAILKAQVLVAQALDDGRILWEYPWETGYDVNAATPIVADGKVFISSGYSHGCALIDFSSGAPKLVWENKELRTHFSSCLLHKGFLYGIDDSGKLKCLNWEKGEVKWQQAGFGKGSLILGGDKLIILSEGGDLSTAEAKPEGFREISRAKVLEKRCWVVPALSSGLLYVKNNEGTLVCLDLRG